MALGRLAWRTPIGALLWEMWGRRKWKFLWHAVALLVGMACAFCKMLTTSEVAGGVLVLVAVTCFLVSYLTLLTWFGYIEADARQLRIGFPSRLLLKPVSTLRLVMVPMAFGGAAVVAVFLLWDKLVLEALGYEGPVNVLWLGGLSLSFFWWLQALAWSLPRMQGRAFAMLVMSLIHVVVGLMPLNPSPVAPCWRWISLGILVSTPLLVAFTGLKWMRRGTWEGPSWFAMIWSLLHPGWKRSKAPEFGSPLRAQFWLEWRINGWVMPGVVAGIAAAIIPVMCFVPGANNDPAIVVLNLMVAAPLFLSGVMSTAIARLDPLEPPGTLPNYIAVRPITNGGILLAKLAASLGSAILTWVIAVAAIFFWLAILPKGTLLSSAAASSGFGVAGILIGSVPVLLLLILFTWKNLLGGVAAVLTGRKWAIAVFNAWRAVLYTALIALILAAKHHLDFKETLLHRLPWFLIPIVVLKLGLAVAAFNKGLRQNALTVGTTCWILGGWLISGMFVAAYAALVCGIMDKLELWIWIALAGFMALPLADLAMAPLCLAWNRHR